MGFLTRTPTPNEPNKPNENKWGSQDPDFDDFAALLNGFAARCKTCRCVVIKRHQKKGPNGDIFCPDHAPA